MSNHEPIDVRPCRPLTFDPGPDGDALIQLDGTLKHR